MAPSVLSLHCFARRDLRLSGKSACTAGPSQHVSQRSLRGGLHSPPAASLSCAACSHGLLGAISPPCQAPTSRVSAVIPVFTAPLLSKLAEVIGADCYTSSGAALPRA